MAEFLPDEVKVEVNTLNLEVAKTLVKIAQEHGWIINFTPESIFDNYRNCRFQECWLVFYQDRHVGFNPNKSYDNLRQFTIDEIIPIITEDQQVFIDGYPVIFHEKYIKVGCQTIDAETVKKIYLKFQEKRSV